MLYNVLTCITSRWLTRNTPLALNHLNNILPLSSFYNSVFQENNAGLVNANNKEEAFKKMKKHKSPELDDYSKFHLNIVILPSCFFSLLYPSITDSIFDPRNMDCGEMDAADREIEQFKLFCRDSVPVQNRTKVSFDVRNIAFKKKL